MIKLLHKALRSFKSEGMTEIKVGVVGYPNVGKSSIINFLRHANLTTVGPLPGTTKSMQVCQVDKKITMLDCPGVIPKSEDDKDGLVLRQAIKFDELADPVGPVAELLTKVAMNDVLKLYHIA